MLVKCPLYHRGGYGSMGDLRGRINSLREEILEELQKRPEELQAEKILELCIVLDKLIVEYISSVKF
mgnify:CR=1 FL=1|jgi:hypothetical protein